MDMSFDDLDLNTISSATNSSTTNPTTNPTNTTTSSTVGNPFDFDEFNHHASTITTTFVSNGIEGTSADQDETLNFLSDTTPLVSSTVEQQQPQQSFYGSNSSRQQSFNKNMMTNDSRQQSFNSTTATSQSHQQSFNSTNATSQSRQQSFSNTTNVLPPIVPIAPSVIVKEQEQLLPIRQQSFHEFTSINFTPDIAHGSYQKSTGTSTRENSFTPSTTSNGMISNEGNDNDKGTSSNNRTLPSNTVSKQKKMMGFIPEGLGLNLEDELESASVLGNKVLNHTLNFLRLPNEAVKETLSRLDLELENEVNEYGESRPGKYFKFIHDMFFGSSTAQGQICGVILLLMITTSVTLAIMDSVRTIREEYGEIIYAFEIFFTFVFAIEYILRVACLLQPRRYILSAMGVVDIASIIPTFVSLFLPPARPLADLATLRIFRVIRVFRVLRLVRFVDAARALSDNINTNKLRIGVFMFGAFSMIVVIGCTMYLVEGEEHGFSSIPVSLYWAVVTLTTVGYGDIAPHTVPGRFIAAFVMFSGYGLIACPLVLNTQTEEEALKQGCECVKCFRSFHQNDANFCRHCGTALRFPENKFKRLQSKKAAKKLQLEKQAAAIAAAAAAGGHSNIAEITPMSMIQLQEQLKRQQQQDEEEEEEHEEEEETIMLKRPLKGAEAVL